MGATRGNTPARKGGELKNGASRREGKGGRGGGRRRCGAVRVCRGTCGTSGGRADCARRVQSGLSTHIGQFLSSRRRLFRGGSDHMLAAFPQALEAAGVVGKYKLLARRRKRLEQFEGQLRQLCRAPMMLVDSGNPSFAVLSKLLLDVRVRDAILDLGDSETECAHRPIAILSPQFMG